MCVQAGGHVCVLRARQEAVIMGTCHMSQLPGHLLFDLMFYQLFFVFINWYCYGYFYYKYSISQLALFFCLVTPASFEKTIKTEHYL